MSFFWKRAESDLDREIAHHIHELTAEYERQGHPRDEALRMAKREFGASDVVKEQCRDERRGAWMTGLWQDVTFGLRMIRRTPVVTAAAVLSLALGIGANTAIVSLMDIVIWRDLPVPNPHQLTLVNWQVREFPRDLIRSASGSMRPVDGWDVADFFSWSAFQSMRRGIADRASLAAYSFPDQVSVSYAGRPGIAWERPVSGNFLQTLKVNPHLGRLFSDNDDNVAAAATVVLSHRFWTQTLASDPSVVGRTLTVNNQPRVIAGILESAFYGLSPGDTTDIYVPMRHGSRQRPAAGAGAPLDDDRFWGVALIARRAGSVTNADLRPVMDGIFRSTWPGTPRNSATTPQIRLDEGTRGLGFLRREFRNPLMVLGALVALLLVIACMNIANLLLARATVRQREVATRVALGCSRGRLMRQFLTESALMAMIGGVVSVAVAVMAANLLGRFIAGRESLPVEVPLDVRILATAGLFTVIALLLFGVFPAWRGASLRDGSTLKKAWGAFGRPRRHGWNTGRLLVVAQMAMSVVLVMAAVLFTRNLLAIESTDLGFDRRNLILFGTRPGTSGYEKSQLRQFYFNLEQRMASTPGASAAGLASVRPMNIGGWWESVSVAGRTERFQATINGITPGYLPMLTPRFVAGRNITWTDITAKAKVAVISEDLARKLGGPSCLGKMLSFSDGAPGQKPDEFEIVGITPAIAATSMKERPHAVWLPLASDAEEATVVMRTSQPPHLVLPGTRETMSGIDRNLPMVDLITMEEQLSKGLQRERMFATLCNGFGILALVLSIVGLYGMIAYGTSRRRAEIGVRLALGAMPSHVVVLVMKEGLGLAVAGLLAGIPVVWLGAKYVQKELFGVKPLEPVSFALVMSILLVSAVFAAGIPALRASALQPTETLRQE